MFGKDESDKPCKFAPNAGEGGKAHNYQIARADFYKKFPETPSGPIGYDKSKMFSVLFCSQCGASKEIQVGGEN